MDTGYLLALELTNDQDYRAASLHWNLLEVALLRLVTSSYVFDEVVTLFNSRKLRGKSVEMGNRLLQSPSVAVVHVEVVLCREGWRYFQQHQDKAYLLTDCISFVIMEERGTRTALTFDKHFVQVGFTVSPHDEA